MDYDFSKYDGKSKVSRESFWKRNDRIFFVKLSRKYNDKKLKNTYSQILSKIKGWVGGFNDSNYESGNIKCKD